MSRQRIEQGNGPDWGGAIRVKKRVTLFRKISLLWGLVAATQCFGCGETVPGQTVSSDPSHSGPVKEYVLLSVQAGDPNPLLNKTVKNPKGQTLGTIEKLILDVKEGKIAYVVVSLETGRLVPLPWSSFTITHDNRSISFDATEEQLANAIIDTDVINILGQ